VTPRRVAVTGASGFVGSALVAALRRDGSEVVTISRRAIEGQLQHEPASGGIDVNGLADALKGVHAVVHLAGAAIGRRWTAGRKREILESRVQGTRLIAETLGRVGPPSPVLVSASAVGYYGDRGDEWLDEESAPGAGFLAGVAVAWERATEPAHAAGARVVRLRFGIVLGTAGGTLPRLLTPFSLGAGGRLGSGRQWMSWISVDDLVAAIRFALATRALSGAVNAVSASPVTNAEFTATLARVLARPAFVHLPAMALRLLFGQMAVETLLASQRVRPARLERAGFAFAQPSLEGALRHVLGR